MKRVVCTNCGFISDKYNDELEGIPEKCPDCDIADWWQDIEPIGPPGVFSLGGGFLQDQLQEQIQKQQEISKKPYPMNGYEGRCRVCGEEPQGIETCPNPNCASHVVVEVMESVNGE